MSKKLRLSELDCHEGYPHTNHFGDGRASRVTPTLAASALCTVTVGYSAPQLIERDNVSTRTHLDAFPFACRLSNVRSFAMSPMSLGSNGNRIIRDKSRSLCGPSLGSPTPSLSFRVRPLDTPRLDISKPVTGCHLLVGRKPTVVRPWMFPLGSSFRPRDLWGTDCKTSVKASTCYMVSPSSSTNQKSPSTYSVFSVVIVGIGTSTIPSSPHCESLADCVHLSFCRPLQPSAPVRKVVTIQGQSPEPVLSYNNGFQRSRSGGVEKGGDRCPIGCSPYIPGRVLAANVLPVTHPATDLVYMAAQATLATKKEKARDLKCYNRVCTQQGFYRCTIRDEICGPCPKCGYSTRSSSQAAHLMNDSVRSGSCQLNVA